MGPTFCKVFATLNLTLATLSVPRFKTVGNINFDVMSLPQASAKTLNKIKIKTLNLNFC